MGVEMKRVTLILALVPALVIVVAGVTDLTVGGVDHTLEVEVVALECEFGVSSARRRVGVVRRERDHTGIVRIRIGQLTGDAAQRASAF